MPTTSRRNFLVVGGTGAAAAGVLAALPDAAGAEAVRPPGREEQMTVHVPDPATGELHLHTADRTVVVRDRDLVIRLQRALEG